MDYITRDTSIITGKKNLEPLITYKNFPVFFGCVETAPETDVRADMQWEICPESGIIQLTKLIPLDVLYQSQHMDGTGATWQEFYQTFAQYIADQNPSRVLEIGGGQGALGEAFITRKPESHWTIVEPNPLHPGNEHISIIKGFFDGSFQSDESYDLVAFSHTLEHAYDPHEFIQAIARYLETGEKLIFAYPNLKLWLENKNISALNFEHTMFLTDYFVDYLLSLYGFKIIDKHEYKDHSFFYTTEKVAEEELQPMRLENKYDEYKKIFLDFADYYKNLVQTFNTQLSSFKEVYVFGGHIFSQYLIEMGLDESRLSGILDNSPIKIGKRLYGSNLFVSSPEILKDKENVAVILKVGPYRKEIMSQLQRINPNVSILE